MVVKEHKYGCSIEVPKCKCNRFFGFYGPHEGSPFRIRLVNGGTIWKKFYFYCHKCKERVFVNEEELGILNKFSTENGNVIYPPELRSIV